MDELNGILVAGAINTDLVATVSHAPGAGETVTGLSFSIHGGGKGANQAVAAARSGVLVALLGAIGADDFGSGRLADLRGEGIDTGWISVIRDVPSGVAMIFIEENGENRIAYVPGATSLVAADVAERAMSEVMPRLVLATNELPRETLSALFARARRDSVPVIFNATPDPKTAGPLLEHVDILIVNHGEAHALVNQPDGMAVELVIERLQHLGPDGVVMTMGEAGVIGRYDGRGFRYQSPVVDVVDTTGAGDTFCGVLAAQLLRGSDLPEAARVGVHAGALAVTTAGAQPSIPDGETIREFITELRE